MSARIVFVIMSAQQKPATVGQLVDSLGDRQVLIHHDHRKQPDFSLRRRNLMYVPEPMDTGWGSWGLSQAIVHSISYALQRLDFDYLQLLSPTCLPIKPVAQFERYLQDSPAQAHIDLIDLDEDLDARVNFAFRAFVPSTGLREAALRRARQWYFGADPHWINRQGLCVLQRRMPPATALQKLRSAAGLRLVDAARSGWLSSHPYAGARRPLMGSMFWGADRSVCESVVAQIRDPSISGFFSRSKMVDEQLFATLIGNSGARIGPSNHLISQFDPHGHPYRFGIGDLDMMLGHRAFFARKFPDDPTALVRRRLLAHLARSSLALQPRPTGIGAATARNAHAAPPTGQTSTRSIPPALARPT